MINVDKLCKWYGPHRGIEEISFRVDSGEVCGLLGLNGAGKTTLLRTLATLLTPTDGEAQVAGFDLFADAERVRANIGFLPDSPAVYDELSVAKMLEFTAAIREVPEGQIKAHVAKAMERLDLLPRAGDAVGSLSHGYRQRVNLAQALVHQPKVLLLDEPTNGLDPVQIIEMRDMILQLKGDHTLIVSSHLLTELTKVCDRFLVVHEGRLVDEGRQSGASAERDFRIVVSGGAGRAGELIEKLPGVEKLKAADEGNRSVLTLSGPSTIRRELLKLAVEHDFELEKFEVAAADSLEQRFVKLVKSHEAQPS